MSAGAGTAWTAKSDVGDVMGLAAAVAEMSVNGSAAGACGLGGTVPVALGGFLWSGGDRARGCLREHAGRGGQVVSPK